jgi:hypothetical protein
MRPPGRRNATPEFRVSNNNPVFMLHRVDAPIPVKKSSGGEPLAVVVGEGVVAFVSAFKPRDDWNTEMSGDGGQGDVFGLPGRPEVGVVVDQMGPGQQSEYFAGDGSFEQPQNLFLRPAVGPLSLDVVAGLWVGRHAHQRDAIQGIVG